MAGGAAKSSSSSTGGVRIVVAGDRGTGKSSLIITAAAESFPTNVPPVLPPTRLPEDMFPEHVPVTVIDTSSRYYYYYAAQLNSIRLLVIDKVWFFIIRCN